MILSVCFSDNPALPDMREVSERGYFCFSVMMPGIMTS